MGTPVHSPVEMIAFHGTSLQEILHPLLLGAKAPNRSPVVVSAVQPIRMHSPVSLAGQTRSWKLLLWLENCYFGELCHELFTLWFNNTGQQGNIFFVFTQSNALNCNYVTNTTQGELHKTHVQANKRNNYHLMQRTHVQRCPCCCLPSKASMVTSVPPTTLASSYWVGNATPRVKGVSGMAWGTLYVRSLFVIMLTWWK